MKMKGEQLMICLNCDGDGYLVFGNGKTKECVRCDGTGEIEKEDETRKDLTKEEFEKGYCERSGITTEEYKNDFNLVTLPCNCIDEDCPKWAAVTNGPRYIRIHNDLYNR